MKEFKKGDLIERFDGEPVSIKKNVPLTFEGYSTEDKKWLCVEESSSSYQSKNFRKWVEVKQPEVKRKIKIGDEISGYWYNGTDVLERKRYGIIKEIYLTHSDVPVKEMFTSVKYPIYYLENNELINFGANVICTSSKNEMDFVTKRSLEETAKGIKEEHNIAISEMEAQYEWKNKLQKLAKTAYDMNAQEYFVWMLNNDMI